MKKSSNAFEEKLREIYDKEHENDFKDELPLVKKIVGAVEKDLGGYFEIIEPVGRGGAGIVVKIRDRSLNYFRALKIPRPRNPEIIDSTRVEIEHLKNLRHKNIIDLYYVGEVVLPKTDEKYPYFVMDYLEGALDLKKHILNILRPKGVNASTLSSVTKWVAEAFYSISKALAFLHSNKIIHFDVKPSNILIGQNNKPLLSDLGFAKIKSNEDKKVKVGFSLPYAHPDLLIEYEEKSSENRVRKAMAPKKFRCAFDIYAFGKSLLEVLWYLQNNYGELVVYNYDFVYLHLAACRMLDGRNETEEETDRKQQQLKEDGIIRPIYKEEWIGIKAKSFDEIKYIGFDEIQQDLEKLLHGKHFLQNVPELNAFFPKRIQSSEGTPAPFSNRVKAIIEHPVFNRLGMVPQLGILSSTYPTATHTRLEHSIGTFRNCCMYVQSLYNDHYNPLFRQLIKEDDIKCILVASLLHDIGQYPLAHEIEEINDAFAHEKISVEFLQNKTQNHAGMTLKEIVENGEWGWGIKIKRIEEIIEKEDKQHPLWKKSFKTLLLRSIIDGPIDADKMDYLIRDSRNCFLHYGQLVDFDRLIRNLTLVVSMDEEGRLTMDIGVYEKGQSAAESITFARYLLYQTLYWHRTARSVRSMLKYVMKRHMKKKRGGARRTFFDELKYMIGVNGTPNKIHLYDVLKLMKDWTVGEGQEIIGMIMERRYYKRIVTIHDDEPEVQKGPKTFIQKFREANKKSGFDEHVRKEIIEAFSKYAQSRAGDDSYFRLTNTDEVMKLLSRPYCILTDCPDPSYGSSGMLNIIPEPQRLYKNYFSRVKVGKTASRVWDEVFFKMMNISAKGRVFCHPSIRNPLMATIGLEGLKTAVKRAADF